MHDVSNAGATMTATLRGGDPAPVLASVQPDTVNNDVTSVDLAVTGSGFFHGATVRFAQPGTTDLAIRKVEWIDHDLLRVQINPRGRSGLWDLLLTNADGQKDTLTNALFVNHLVAAALAEAHLTVEPGRGVRLRFRLVDLADGESPRVERAPAGRDAWVVPSEAVLAAEGGGWYRFEDPSVAPGDRWRYRILLVDPSGSRQLWAEEIAVVPLALRLEQNRPNPFNPNTIIAFSLPERTRVRLEVLDVRGRRVRRLHDGVLPAGEHRARWDGRDDRGRPVASGIYLYRLEVPGHRPMVRKMVLLR
jgi:hypothetical protein